MEGAGATPGPPGAHALPQSFSFWDNAYSQAQLLLASQPGWVSPWGSLADPHLGAACRASLSRLYSCPYTPGSELGSD